MFFLQYFRGPFEYVYGEHLGSELEDDAGSVPARRASGGSGGPGQAVPTYQLVLHDTPGVWLLAHTGLQTRHYW